VCGVIGHSENFCSDKFESGSENSEKKWGAYLRAENNSIGDGNKEASKWIVGGRSKNSGGRKEEGVAINGVQSHSRAITSCGISNHRIFGRIKVGINAETRSLTFFKYTECQRSDGTGLVRWWTEIDPAEVTIDKVNQEDVRMSTKLFALNLNKSDKVNKVLAEGMPEKDEFLYANGGGAEALWKLIELEAQHKDNPQNSRIDGSKAVAARDGLGAANKQMALGPT
jgi:hypothetical protein